MVNAVVFMVWFVFSGFRLFAALHTQARAALELLLGFFITVPDLNRLIGKFNGKFGLWQKLRLLWDLKVRKSCDRIFGIIFGIAPEFHGRGVESAIMVKYYEFLEMTKNQYKSMELAWIGDFNPVMNRMIETYVCATKHKMHTTYRYLFDREKEFKRCPDRKNEPADFRKSTDGKGSSNFRSR